MAMALFYALTIVDNFFIIVFFYCFFSLKLKFKENRRIIIPVAIFCVSNSLVFYLLKISTDQFVSNNHITWIILNTLRNVSYHLLCGYFFFKAKAVIILVVSFLIIGYSILADVLAAVSVMYLLGNSSIMGTSATGYLLVGLATGLLKIGTICLLRKFRNGRILYGGSVKESISQVLIPLISLLFLMFYLVRGLAKPEMDHIELLILVITLMLTCLIQYYVFEMYQRNAKKEYYAKLAEQESNHRETYYRSVERYQKEIREIKHELKNQLIMVSGYLEDSEGANKYVAKLMDRVEKQEVLNFTAHTGLNALLSVKYQEAEAAGILCDYDISLPQEMQFKSQDLTGLLGNILDNAIEGSLKSLNRPFLRLQVVYFQNALVICCKNRTDGLVENLNTRKSNQLDHGFGSQVIQETVNCYHGDCQYQIEGDRFKIELTLWENKSSD